MIDRRKMVIPQALSLRFGQRGRAQCDALQFPLTPPIGDYVLADKKGPVFAMPPGRGLLIPSASHFFMNTSFRQWPVRGLLDPKGIMAGPVSGAAGGCGHWNFQTFVPWKLRYHRGC